MTPSPSPNNQLSSLPLLFTSGQEPKRGTTTGDRDQQGFQQGSWVPFILVVLYYLAPFFSVLYLSPAYALAAKGITIEVLGENITEAIYGHEGVLVIVVEILMDFFQ